MGAVTFDIQSANALDPNRYGDMYLNLQLIAGAPTTLRVWVALDVSPFFGNGITGYPVSFRTDLVAPPNGSWLGDFPWTAGDISIPAGPLLQDLVNNTVQTDLISLRDFIEYQYLPNKDTSNGQVLFGFEFVPNNGASASVTPTLTGTRVPFYTGVMGGPHAGDRTRMVLDDRYGMPTSVWDITEDEYLEGRYVRVSDKDPEDPDPEYTGNPTEGERYDDVPLD
jgi:hypothetical protein